MRYLWTAFAALFLLTACGEKVEVPPAHVGKILTKNGYKPDTVPPSKFRLEWCWAYCDKLVTLEIADQSGKESFKLFMPKDQLNMTFDVRFTLAVPNDETVVAQIFDRVSPSISEGGLIGSGDSYINVAQVYEVYGRPVIRDVVRRTMAQYDINEVANNRERISQELFQVVTAELKGTPLLIKRFGLADVQFPEIITQAKEAAAQRRIDIEQEEAKKQIRLVKMQADLEAARRDRNIRKEKAMAILEENEIIAKSVTPDYLAYRQLEVLEQMAKSNNAVFVPVEALGTLGLENRIFKGQ